MATRTYTIALHAHSTWSYDGHWTLGGLSHFFGRLGYDAVVMTEHDTGFKPEDFAMYRAECSAHSTMHCRLIPGIEYSSPDNDIHILTLGLKSFLAEHRPVMETLHAVDAAKGAAIFAHPIRRNAFEKFDEAFVPYLHGIELWNRKSDGLAPTPQAETLIAKSNLPITVGSDFHVLRHFWPLSLKVELAVDLSNEGFEIGLVEAVRNGKFYPAFMGRRLKIQNGRAQVPLSRGLESARKTIRDLVRGKREKRHVNTI